MGDVWERLLLKADTSGDHKIDLRELVALEAPYTGDAAADARVGRHNAAVWVAGLLAYDDARVAGAQILGDDGAIDAEELRAYNGSGPAGAPELYEKSADGAVVVNAADGSPVFTVPGRALYDRAAAAVDAACDSA